MIIWKLIKRLFWHWSWSANSSIAGSYLVHFKARQAPLTSSVSLVRFILFNAENKDSKKHVDEKIVRKAGFFMSLKVSGNPSTQNVMRVTQNEFACHPG